MSRRSWIAVVAVVVLLAVGAGTAWLTTSDDDDAGGGPGGPASPGSTTTTLPRGVTPLDTTAVVWPTAASGERFTDPAAAARSFATDYLGFAEPVVGPFRRGADGTGDLEVRSRANAPTPTVVELRRLEPDDDWWVVGATTANIELEEPEPIDAIASPVSLRGRSTAFEGTVQVEVRADDRSEPLARSFVTGGATAELGPFAGEIAFESPGDAANGAIVLAIHSAENGRLAEATVVRVRFGDRQPEASEASEARVGAACDEAPARPPLGAGQSEVRVYFTCGDPPAPPRARYRIVPATTALLRAALDQLVAGPTAAERALGYRSSFSAETFGSVRSVDLDPDGAATVDLVDLRRRLAEAATGTGPALLLAQLDATVFQFPTVSSVVYRFEGSCEDFTEWLGATGCVPRQRP
ncbi:MAG: Gmad2 immunoglobulin-like domain-containing protein [Acidimicrobiia bacterium]